MTVLERERDFHDSQAAARMDSFQRGDASLRFKDADYLDHAPWLRPAMALLGNLNRKHVLDLGCGHGMASVVFARAGAIVDAIDLSPGYVNETRARADANGVVVTTVAAEAESLPFADDTFDAVWGSAILHHLDLPRMCEELRRVLKPGGIAVFCEPFDGNPLLRLARRWLPYPGKHRTPDERPLRFSDVRILKQYYQVEIQGFQIVGMLDRLSPRLRFLNAIDRMMPRFVRNRWGRYLVVRLSA